MKTLTTASTGNAAAALAGLAASVGLEAVIFVPKSAPPAKIAQHLIYGARVLLVDGSYDDAFDLTLEVASEFGWYNRNTACNPFMTEGKKTASYEIWEQLGGGSWVVTTRLKGVAQHPLAVTTYRDGTARVLNASDGHQGRRQKYWSCSDTHMPRASGSPSARIRTSSSRK